MRGRWTKLLIFIVADIVAVLLGTAISYGLRFEFHTTPYASMLQQTAPILVLSYLAWMYILRIYQRVWRYAGSRELFALIYSGLGACVTYAAITMAMGLNLPRSLYVILFIVITGIIGFGRLMFRYVSLKYYSNKQKNEETVPVLIVGAGDAGAIIAREIMTYHAKNRELVGFVDDDPKKVGRLLAGQMIMGDRHDIPRLVAEHGIKEIVIAMPSAKAATVKEIVSICAPLKCKTNILPGLYQLLDGNVSLSQMRPIEIEDLLQREPVRLDMDEIAAYLEGKVVLVTGAGGSIGSEICRSVMRMKPAKLILLGHGENSIYLINKELSKQYGADAVTPVVADIRDTEQLMSIFAEYKPEVVFHAAAHKHVPLMEAWPMSAVLNNILGTRSVADVAGRSGVRKFVMISTDKAVNPTSVMGASKRIAEKVIQAMNTCYPTEYVTVRFGNVLGSRGSVVPLFREQIAKGGPVTVTHEEMIRYFMTIPEASQLVLQAGAMGKGGELFLLDMGEPVKIIDLARNMIRLSGFEPGTEIPIQITGLRPGEKLYEELLTAEEGTEHTKHEKIYEARIEPLDADWLFAKIEELLHTHSADDIIAIFKEIIPTYHSNHTSEAANAVADSLIRAEATGDGVDLNELASATLAKTNAKQ